MKPPHARMHHEHHKPLAEKYQTLITCSVAIVLIFAVIFGVGWYVPMGPDPSPEITSKLGLDKASRPGREAHR